MRLLTILAAILCLTVASGVAAPVEYALPDETAALSSGPGLEIAQANCTGCHSADYITTQPRDLGDPKAFWSAEVVKMQKAYGAPVDPADVPKIVDYLAQTYAH